jgi:cysteine synthase
MRRTRTLGSLGSLLSVARSPVTRASARSRRSQTDDAKEMARRIAREEALFAGTSSGANVVAAIQVAERLGPEATVVTLMADSGLKYLSTDVYRSR